MSVDLALAQEPEAEATPLPPVTVETQGAAPKAKKKAAKKKASAAAVGVPSQQPVVAPQKPAGIPRTNDGTAHGPVEGYVAQNTATGIKTNTPLKEIPQSISVVGTEQMRDQGVQSVSEALRYVPGVVAESHGADSRVDGYFIRGIAAAEYLDGMRRNFSDFWYGYRGDPYLMERIEVLRGPAAVSYGQSPVGGIINSVSKRPTGETGGEIGFEYGTFDFKQMKFDTNGLITTDGSLAYRVTGVVRVADSQTDHVEDDRFAIQPGITWKPTSDTTVTLLGHYQRDRSGSTQQIWARVGTLYPNVNGRRIPRSNFMGDPGDYFDTDVAAGTLFIEHDINPAIKVKHVSRYSDVQKKYDVKYPAIWGYTDFATQESMMRAAERSDANARTFTQDTNIEVGLVTGALKHRILSGVDYAHLSTDRVYGTFLDVNSVLFGYNVYNPPYTMGDWIPFGCAQGCFTDQTITQTGVYLQDQMRLGNWIGVVGVRHDWVENDTVSSAPPAASQSVAKKQQATTYRAGLMYEFAFGLTPYISYAESFLPVAGTNRQGTPHDPQTGRQYEVGFKFQPTGANFAINGAVFDIAETGRLVPDGTFQRQLGAVSVKGFEIEAVGQLTRNLKIMGGYSYTQAEYDDKRPHAHNGMQIESVPKHLASMWALWEFDQPMLKGWSVGGGARYIGENWTEKSNASTVVHEIPSVTLYDAMIAYENENWRWQLTGRNLEDKYYVSTCLARGDCWLSTARTITTGITYKY
ncbi:TonB-dependent siderophore receptor [Hyphomicrobium sp. D-2]|uniref:TonB-dependent siderophore receptor n=1 Tax=Hyphomicrobium sp. D-2 TaxID=3041621 RepID=UPI00245722F4|nr:TonB-dependent siderophore receptor [Hyphomicrobium sp. D-2]MDH4981228.1 TonB-dependent siderophore receptor [Hyphomicrobium sp. D-2]